jgi:scyllo-inositol 2-dehydrogenase (NADP+)
MKAGIIGFGLSGRIFNLPLAQSAGIEIVSVAVADASKYSGQSEVTFVSTDELFSDPSIELVIVASPNAFHSAHAAAALRAGKHVVIEKPLALNSVEVESIAAAAREGTGVASVFHSRRWDGDFLTLKEVVDQGSTGNWKIFESSWSMNKPQAQQRWKDQDTLGGGLLTDFMPHLIDQALCLFGIPDTAALDRSTQRAGSLGADYLAVTLRYGEKRARLMVDCFSPAPRQRFRLAGDRGEYLSTGIDNQEDHLRRGIAPTSDDFGAADATRASELVEFDGRHQPISLKRGDYVSFYRNLRIAIETGGQPPVSLHEAGRVIEIIDALNRNQVWVSG